MIKSTYSVSEKEQNSANKAHEIMFEFKYNIKHRWVDQSWINHHDRLWIATFNKLVSQNLIEKKNIKGKKNYRWNAQYPINF